MKIRRGKTKALKPFVSSMCFIPEALIGLQEVQSLKSALTITYYDPHQQARRGEDDAEVEPRLITCYNASVEGYIGVPRAFGFERFPDMVFQDRTVKGANVPNAFDGISRIKPRTEQQREYFAAIEKLLKRDEITDFISVAKTGSGKTAALINALIRVRKPMLVVVHTNRLKNQWLGSKQLMNGLRFFCGDEFVDNYVGVIQQGQCDYENKLVGIALVHSLAGRKYPEEFYTHWHSVQFDELHMHTAPHFAKVAELFPQQVRGGTTATMREDELRKVAHWHFGKIAVTSEQKVLKPDIYICVLPKKLSSGYINEYSDGTILNSLAKLKYRNDIITKVIYGRGFKRGKQILVISDRVSQLQQLYDNCKELGIPKSAMGMYTGEVYTGFFRAHGKLNGKRYDLAKNDYGLPLFRNKEEIKKVVKGLRAAGINLEDVKIVQDSYKPSDKYYARMEKRCSIFFATYGIFSTGNDIARLDFGVEATPRTDQRQPLGRILREAAHKTYAPEWYSFADEIEIEREDGKYEMLEGLVKSNIARRKRFASQEARIINVSNVLKKFK